MRKRLIVVVLMIFLSFAPAYAGHSLAGEYACTCDMPGCLEDYPGECKGHGMNQQSQPPGDGTVELGVVIVALLLLLRLKSQ